MEFLCLIIRVLWINRQTQRFWYTISLAKSKSLFGKISIYYPHFPNENSAGTWEVRPARRVERIVSTYTGMISGTPSPPSSVGVRTRSVVLHSEPRAVMPSECCTHRAARQRASVKTSQMGTPPWTGKTRRRQSVLLMTSLSCEKDGESPAHVL